MSRETNVIYYNLCLEKSILDVKKKALKNIQNIRTISRTQNYIRIP